MGITIIVFSFTVILLFLVAAHETGHMIAAKRAGVMVEEFGIGLPPRLFAIKRGETEYSINLIPLGAFVKTPGESDPTVPGSLASKGPWTRLTVYAAGPIVNVFLAVAFLSIFFMLPYNSIEGNGTMVHSVSTGSPAEENGIQSGDIILKIDGADIHNWEDVRDGINANEGEQLSLLLQRNGEQFESTLKPEFDSELDRYSIGILLCWGIVTQTVEGSPAEDADIRPGDTILSINGDFVYSQDSMLDTLSSIDTGEELDIVLQRENDIISTTLILNSTDGWEAIGFDSQWVSNSRIETHQLSPWQAIWRGGDYVVRMPYLIKESMPIIREDPSLAAVGVVGGLHLTIEAVRDTGFGNVLLMGGVISLGLAIFNFLPVPPLDGGGMLISLIEGIRRGKRLSPKTVRLAYLTGIALMVTFFVVVMYNDISRLIDYIRTGESGFNL